MTYEQRSMPCADCGVDTGWYSSNPEVYTADHQLWEDHVGWRRVVPLSTEAPRGVIGPGSIYLCIGCLEDRVMRQLTPDDFVRCPLNCFPHIKRSPRLVHRLGPLIDGWVPHLEVT